MNSIVLVGDGDGLYGEQCNHSGDRRVSIILRDLNPGRRLFSFIDLFPPYFLKLCENIHTKTPLKCDFSV
jgi:hypothetical protein